MIGFKQLVYLLIFSSILLCNFANAQENKIPSADDRIADVFGIDYIIRMLDESPQRLAYLTYYLENSYFIDDLPVGKQYSSTDDILDKNGNVGNLIIDLYDLTNFNVLNFNFKRNQKTRTFYQIGDSNKMIVFYSQNEFLKGYNEQRSE